MNKVRGARRVKFVGMAAMAVAGLAALSALTPSCKVETVEPPKCAGDNECEDGDKCTTNECGADGACKSTPSDDPTCECSHENDCYDEDPCTEEACTEGHCTFTPIPGCGEGGGGGEGGSGGGGMGGGGSGPCDGNDVCDAEEDCACQDCSGLPECEMCATVEVIELAQKVPPFLDEGIISPPQGGPAQDDFQIVAAGDAMGTFQIVPPADAEWCGAYATCFFIFEDVAAGTPAKTLVAVAGTAECGSSTPDQLACTLTNVKFIESELIDIGGGMMAWVTIDGGKCIDLPTTTFDFQI
jgi:hypothetical protein